MVEEEWKPIKGFEGIYEISNTGIVRGIEHIVIDKKGTYHKIKSSIKAKQKDKDGYERVGLWHNGKPYSRQVHRLVAEAHIPNPDNLPQVNHKNEIKNDNRVENLEWCSVAYNNNYRNKTINTRKKVNQYDLNGNFIKTWDCIIQAAKYYGINRSLITDVCKGRRKTAKGFIWRYYE